MDGLMNGWTDGWKEREDNHSPSSVTTASILLLPALSALVRPAAASLARTSAISSSVNRVFRSRAAMIHAATTKKSTAAR